MAQEKDPQFVLESCRPDSEDMLLTDLAPTAPLLAADDELAKQFNLQQQWDRLLCDAMVAGEVPADLQDRILAQVRDADDVDVVSLEKASQSHSVNRRGWLWWSLAAAATLAAIATGIGIWLRQPQPLRLSEATLQANATRWSKDLVGDQWNTMPAPDGYRPASDVLRMPSHWQRFAPDELESVNAVAYRYQVQHPSIRRMTLLVFKADLAGLPAFPPRNPQATQDRLVAIWRVGDRAYVLVLQGEPLDQLQQFYRDWVNLDRNMA